MKLAEQGKAEKQFWLGLCYYYGINFEKDLQRAEHWYRKAAEQGLADAQTLLGLMYQDGTGVPKNLDEATKWLRNAADQNQAQALNALVWLLATTSDTVVRNPTEAVERAQRLSKTDAAHADSYAAALAADGQFDKAIEVQTAAMALAIKSGKPVDGYAIRLALYQSGTALKCPGMDACN